MASKNVLNMTVMQMEMAVMEKATEVLLEEVVAAAGEAAPHQMITVLKMIQATRALRLVDHLTSAAIQAALQMAISIPFITRGEWKKAIAKEVAEFWFILNTFVQIIVKNAQVPRLAQNAPATITYITARVKQGALMDMSL